LPTSDKINTLWSTGRSSPWSTTTKSNDSCSSILVRSLRDEE